MTLCGTCQSRVEGSSDGDIVGVAREPQAHLTTAAAPKIALLKAFIQRILQGFVVSVKCHKNT